MGLQTMFWEVLLWQTGVLGAERVDNNAIRTGYEMMGNRKYCFL
jgi:hypothetical protein